MSDITQVNGALQGHLQAAKTDPLCHSLHTPGLQLHCILKSVH